MNTETMLAMFAIVVALGVVGVIAVESISIAQQAQAKQPIGRVCEFTPGGNASKARCVH
jgi:hypothetical protein